MNSKNLFFVLLVGIAMVFNGVVIAADDVNDQTNSNKVEYRDVNPSRDAVKSMFEIVTGLTIIGTGTAVGGMVGTVGGMFTGALYGYGKADSAGAGIGCIFGAAAGCAAGAATGAAVGAAIVSIFSGEDSTKKDALKKELNKKN